MVESAVGESVLSVGVYGTIMAGFRAFIGACQPAMPPQNGAMK